MKIIIAPDSFKGSLSSAGVADNIERGILKALPGAEIVKIPIADGGEGTVKTLVDATDGTILQEQVRGPLGDRVIAEYGLLGDGETAVIEMAAASGLPLVPVSGRDPSLTTTYGTGELIKAALEQQVKKIVIGIGGSATNDAGIGMARALGVEFRDKTGKEVEPIGNNLDRIVDLDTENLDPRLKDVEVLVACDVNSPFYGPRGAACVYAPQKGASEQMVMELDKKLKYFAGIIREKFGIDLQSIPGSGAAGGMGGGLVVFFAAQLKSGIDIVLELTEFEKQIEGADLILTGEGQIDGQTLAGKTPMGVAEKARKHNIPVVAVTGMLGPDYHKLLTEDNGITALFSIQSTPISLEESIKNTDLGLQYIGEQIARLYFVPGTTRFLSKGAIRCSE